MPLTALALTGVATWDCQAQVTDDWGKYLRLGAVAGMNLRAEFSMSGVITPTSGATGTRYDDGFVATDDTGNAGGYTSYWGYDNANQVQGGNIFYHRAESITSPSGSFASGREANGLDVGLDAAYGSVLTLWGRTLIGWELGLTYLPLSFKDDRSFAARITRSTFSHAAPPFVPGAPYVGGKGGVGPLLSATQVPVSQGQPVGGVLSGRRELDATLYNFKLGPTFYWDLSRRFALQASVGGSVGLVNGEYSFQEVAEATDGSRTSLSGGFSSRRLAYGGYAGINVLWHTSEKADVFVGAQYLRLGSATYSGSGRQAKVDLNNGIYFTAGLNWPF